MKKSFILLIILVFTLSTAFVIYRPQKKNGLRKVVIDAGHGGHDPGTVGKKSKEKDIALEVALRLGRMIQENFPAVEVIFTRKTDVFVELYRRAQIANESKADLFISIHCNGTRSTAARGVETWVMGLHKSKENLEVAKKENASILMEDNYSKYDGFDPNSPEANIIFSLYQNVYLDQSLDIATRIQRQFQQSLGLLDRGVKQAGFWVLYKTTMPGILVETGFLSNPDDEAYLLSDKGQEEISTAIFQAFSDYKKAFEAETSPLVVNASKSDTKEPPAEVKKEVTPVPEKKVDREGGKITEAMQPGVQEKQASIEKPVFKVQIITSPKKLTDGSPSFKGMKGVGMYQQKGTYKYTVGECYSLKEALGLQAEMQQKGFTDSFVVAFIKGERVSMEEAKRLLLK